jgi:hypothetical protein
LSLTDAHLPLRQRLRVLIAKQVLQRWLCLLSLQLKQPPLRLH